MDKKNDLSLPKNCYYTPELVVVGDSVTSVTRCIPQMDMGVIRVKAVGDMTTVTFQRAALAKGVNVREVHDYNTANGLVPNSEEKEEKKKESRRVSVQTTITAIRELVACNPWRFFCTITLSPEMWDRKNPEGLQLSLKEEAKAWRRKKIENDTPYKGYIYLMIPELHHNAAVHMHGFVNLIPAEFLKRYTMADTKNQKLPQYIIDALREGRKIYHCTEWDEKYGYNVIEPINGLARAANYATKYVCKDMGNADIFKSRYWCSRGLKRAETVAVFRSPVSDDALAEYTDLMLPCAAVTPSGEVLHKEYFAPKTKSAKPSGFKTVIDGDTMSTEEVCAMLAEHYQTAEDFDANKAAYDYVPASLRTLADHCNDAHDAVLYEKSKPEFYEVAEDGELPF